MIQRPARVEHALELSPRVDQQQWAVPVHPDPRSGIGQSDVEEHDVVPREPLPCAVVQYGAAAECQDTVVLVESCRHGDTLELAKGRLAIVDEDVPDRLAGRGFDVGIDVPEPDAEALGEQPANRRLAGSRRTDQDDPRAHWTARTPGKASR